MAATAARMWPSRSSSGDASAADSTGEPRRRQRLVSKARSVVDHSTATIPRVVAARWNGPQGPGIEVRTAPCSSIARVSHRYPGWYTPREYEQPDRPARDDRD